ncbi:MAG: hypothetical protein KDE19_04635, partial [Caldilineaceae bacterium]|nr:hypothetical protein [Caldilineaceae bacterium]
MARLWWAAILLLYLLLAGYQLGLPGLHYDEAREAGLNTLEILTGAPITAFRETGLPLFGRQWPLMVQDYIGALNVYLALPFLGLTGIGVPNLRFLSILIGLLTLILVERTVSEWLRLVNRQDGTKAEVVPLSFSGLLAMTLLAAAPTFLFWSRQGIFVTNLTQPLLFGCLWQGIRWLRLERPRFLLWSAFWGGCALYAKLLALWVIGPFVLLAGGWWLWQRKNPLPASPDTEGGQPRPHPAAPRGHPPGRGGGGLSLALATVIVFLLPLLPLIWFNIESGGTFSAIAGNLGTSYYGVNNLALWSNLGTRLVQLRQVLQGDHLWYLGGIYGNPVSFWGGIVVLLLASFRRPWRLLPPLLLALLALAASLFTISDLFVTHYALLHPLLVAIIAIAFSALFWTNQSSAWWQRLGYLCVLLWFLLDLTATLRYHSALTRSGGLADHSDASYHLAYYLRYNGFGAPIALDWGFDATVRYLSQGTVTPIEIFGYASPQAPDADFAARLQPFLENSDNVYLLHVSHATVFAGRRERF